MFKKIGVHAGHMNQVDVHKQFIITVSASKTLCTFILGCEYTGLQAPKGNIFRTLGQDAPEQSSEEPGKINCQ